MIKQTEKIADKKATNDSLGNKLTNRKLAVFSIFLLLSFLFWYLDALGNQIQADIKYPVTYKNIPDLIDSAKMPQRITLLLNGTGFSILRLQFTGKSNPVTVDFSKVSYKRSNNQEEGLYYLITAGMESSFSSQIKPGCTISSVSPDTLYFYSKTE
jgi:hypothetical protein